MRAAQVPGKPTVAVVGVRLTQDDVAALDLLRGGSTRSTWLRDMLRREAGTVPHEATLEPTPEPIQDEPEQPKPEQIVVPPRKDKTSKRHLHRGDVVATRVVRGIKTETIKCATCDAQWERT